MKVITKNCAHIYLQLSDSIFTYYNYGNACEQFYNVLQVIFTSK